MGSLVGILLADAGLPVHAALAIGGLAIAAGLAVRLRGGGATATAWLLAWLALTAGALALGLRLEAARDDRPAQPFDARIEGDVARVTQGATSARVELRRVRSAPGTWGDARVPRSLELFSDARDAGGLAARPAGCRVRAWVRITPLASRRNPGAVDPRVAGARRGLGARARLLHPGLHAAVAGGCRPGPLARFRRVARAGLREQGIGGAGLSALALGDAAALPVHLREAFAQLGLAHLLAVSGLHLAWVAGLAFAAGRALVAPVVWRLAPGVDGRRVAIGCAWMAAGAYALVTGAGVPVQRAFVLLSSVAITAWRRRPGRGGDALRLAAAILLLADPGALFSVGAQLSFAATAALLHARQGPAAPQLPGSERLGLLARIESALRITGTALLGTAPLLAWHFGSSAPVGLLTNLVAVPLVGAGFLPLALLAACLAPWPAAEPVVGLAAALMGAVLQSLPAVADAAPAWPLHRPGAVSLLVGCGLALWGLCVRGTSARLFLLGLVSLVLARGPAPPWPYAGPAVVAFDVGQGDAVLLRGRAATVLVDGGAAAPGRFDQGRAVVVPALLALGVESLDLVVATHADSDHRGGLPAILRAIRTDALWLPHGGREDPAFAELREVARRRGIPIAERGAGSAPARFGDVEVTPLWPPRRAASADRNARSLVVRVAIDGTRILLPGDAPQAVERALVARGLDLRAELLIVGHHGSRTSTSAAWLRAVAPRVAIISAPHLSRFGFPHQEVRDHLARAGVGWCWTGRDGAVALSLRPSAPWLQARETAARGAPPSGVCSRP